MNPSAQVVLQELPPAEPIRVTPPLLRVKQRLYPMLGFQSFADATTTTSGVELAQRLRKGQFNTSGVIVRGGARVPHVWEAVLAG